MCRSIKVLRTPEQVTTPVDINAAALQFVRKISGFRQPSRANKPAFDRAVSEIAEASRRLLESMGTAVSDDAPGIGAMEQAATNPRQ